MRLDEPVTATVTDDVYVGDSLAIPAGSKIAGHVTSLTRPPADTRVRDASGGDFTPKDVATIRFDTLTLPDQSKKTVAAQSVSVTDAPAASAGQWLKEYILGQLPYHRRYVHKGAEYVVTLIEPLTIGADAEVRLKPDTTYRVRLARAIDSSSARADEHIRVIVDQPFAGHVEGQELDGTIARVTRAGAMHRQGRIELLVDGMRGIVTIPDSKWRFALPMLAAGALPAARDADRGHVGNFFGRSGAGWSGFEMIGAAISETSGPVALGFGAWGLARGLWINVFSKGHDVVLSPNTIIDLSSPP